MLDDHAFGVQLRRYRTRAGLTQEALAEQAGLTAHAISALERGERRHPYPHTVEALAQALHLSADEQAALLAARAASHQAAPPTPAPSVVPASPASPPAPILATKLYVPQPRAALVPRPRLRARLDRGLAGSLTLIAAPAGFGKTTLLADWLVTASHAPEPPIRTGQVAWLSLDVGDNDPLQFLRYLVAALQTVAPEVGRATLAVLQSAQAPPIVTLLPLVANDLAALSTPCILVLDDYHVIDAPAVHQALTFLLEHLPPQLHLVIATRVDPPLPLSRLRVRGQLTELRAHDLRFTSEEAALFLREVMGVPLSGEEVAALEARTEGWVAGLHLAALSLHDRPPEQMAGFIDAFTGSHRFVVDYLVDEVLARQPAHLQTFLLHTSILERLSGALCDAIMQGDTTERAETHGPGEQASSQMVLEQLERANLFLVPLDDTRHWYRYHHLFAQVLHERLMNGASQDVVAMLHRRASVWFEQHGLLPEAMEHVFAAREWERAARLLEQHTEPMLMRGEIRTLHHWVQVLPRDVARKQPHLLLGYAWAQCRTEPDAVEATLRDAESVLNLDEAGPAEQGAGDSALDRESAELRGKLAAIRASIGGNQHDLPRRIALAHEALTLLPEDNLFWRISPTVDLGLALAAAGEVGAASHAFTEAIDLCRKAGHSYAAMIATMHLARVRAAQGQLHAAAALHQRALEMAAEQGWGQLPIVGLPHVWLGKLLYEWNDLPSATRHLLAGIKLAEPGEQRILLEGYTVLARVQQAHGDSAAALATIHECDELARAHNFPASLIAHGAAARAHLALMQGDREQAVHWANTSGLHPTDDLRYPREWEYLTLARVRIAQVQNDAPGSFLRDALDLLDRLLEIAEASARINSMIDILVLRALALQMRGDRNAALAALERALSLTAPEGYVRVFVDEGAPMAALLAHGLAERTWGLGDGTQGHDVRGYTHQLLAVFRAAGIEPQAGVPLALSAPRVLTSDGEMLTEREQEVLRLLVAGCSNQVIAAELIVAVGTVKRHVSNIMSKLGVQSRLEAVARARELGLA